MQRILIRAVTAVLASLLAVYAADSILWHIRNAHGSGMDDVTVTQVSAASLKRNREEYYVDGAITVTCARSIFPQITPPGSLPPCWYLRRNHLVVTHL